VCLCVCVCVCVVFAIDTVLLMLDTACNGASMEMGEHAHVNAHVACPADSELPGIGEREIFHITPGSDTWR